MFLTTSYWKYTTFPKQVHGRLKPLMLIFC